jgi:SAM-dependent methyltransferase
MRAHAERFVDEVLAGGPGSSPRILEVASHGGHMALRFAAHGVRSLVVDSSEALVESARAIGLDAAAASLSGESAAALRRDRGPFDVIVDSYLLAHQRQLDPQLAAFKTLLAKGGRAVLEFNHLLPIVRGTQFDAIRHGHFSYLSLGTLLRALERHGLHGMHASVQPAYGGSMRLWVASEPASATDPTIAALLVEEAEAGLGDLAAYERFAKAVNDRRKELRAFLTDAAAEGRRVVGYGAPSRGSTLLNASGITPDLLVYTVDASPAKQGLVMPGSGIPILDPARIFQDRPDDVLILTWDLADEVVDQLSEIRAWGGRFITPFPSLSVR